MSQAPKRLRVRIGNSGRLFEGPAATVIGQVLHFTAGSAGIDVSDDVGRLAGGLDPDVAYEITFGGPQGDEMAAAAATAFLAAGLTELTAKGT